MTAPLPVQRCRKAVKAMQRLGEKATAGPWHADLRYGEFSAPVIEDLFGTVDGAKKEEDTASIVAARATHSALWEMLDRHLDHYYSASDNVYPPNFAYAPLAAAIAHLDATQPGWEEEV